MSKIKYLQVEEGKWVSPTHKGYRESCCDCSLVHRVDFRVVKRGKRNEIQFRCWRDDRATAAMRRGKR